MLCLFLGLVAGACGGEDGIPTWPSGVDRSKYVDELSASEVEQLCAWSASILLPGEYKCSEDTTMQAHTTSQCADSVQAKPRHCLVSLTEDCVASTQGDPCQMMVTAPCLAYIECVAGK